MSWLSMWLIVGFSVSLTFFIIRHICIAVWPNERTLVFLFRKEVEFEDYVLQPPYRKSKLFLISSDFVALLLTSPFFWWYHLYKLFRLILRLMQLLG
jgi:hypothetical protein